MLLSLGEKCIMSHSCYLFTGSYNVTGHNIGNKYCVYCNGVISLFYLKKKMKHVLLLYFSFVGTDFHCVQMS